MDTYWPVLQLILHGLVVEVPDLAEVGTLKPASPFRSLKTFVKNIPRAL